MFMKVNFYWDDISLIEAYANKPFDNIESIKIYRDGELVDYELEKIKTNRFHLHINDSYHMTSNYKIEYKNKSYDIEYRMIVQSDWFEDKMLPDIDSLGSFYHEDYTLFRVWAAFSDEVTLVLKGQQYPMRKGLKGVYEIRIDGNFDGAAYWYIIKRNNLFHRVVDPFAYGSGANAFCSYVLDVNKFKKGFIKPQNIINSYCDAIIYEISVYDFSPEKYFEYPHTFKALLEDNYLDGEAIGLNYLKELGITHVQMMPIFDFGTVDEIKKDGYNWGYDPVQYNVLDGIYIHKTFDPYSRINEFVEVVNKLHENNIRINLDVVFNHVYKLELFPFNYMCPYYFFRYKEDKTLSDGSFCGNEIRSEAKFVQAYILKMVERYIDIFDIDGLRFDLMGLIDLETINKIIDMSQKKKRDFMVYGEGWQMPTVLPSFSQATIYNASSLKKTAFFNPYFRDVIKGSSFADHIEDAGFALGNLNNTEAAKRMLSGDKNDGFVTPSQSINYLECHDNYTFYDKMVYACPLDDEKTRIKKTKLALSLILLSQGIPFIHCGQEFMRTKDGLDNTYNNNTGVNDVDWQRKNKYLELVNYTRDLIRFRKRYPFLRLNNYDEINKIVKFENYYEVLVYNIANFKILINACPFHHLYDIDSNCRQVYSERGRDDVRISKCVGVPEYSIVILELID